MHAEDEEAADADASLAQALEPLKDLSNRRPSTQSTIDWVYPTPALLKYQSPRQKRARLSLVSTGDETQSMSPGSLTQTPKSQRWQPLSPSQPAIDPELRGPGTPRALVPHRTNSKESPQKAQRLSLEQTPSPSKGARVHLQRTNSKDSPSKAADSAGAPTQQSYLQSCDFLPEGHTQVNVLGKTAERTVVQAKNPQNEQVVVKCIEKSRFLAPRPGRSLIQEAELMKELEHPGIVKLLHFMEDSSRVCLIMEYVPGGDMYHHMVKHGRFPELQAARLLRQLVDALSYVHSKNIVHRDLKPENLLLSSADRDTMQVKIGDFGISRQSLSSEDCQTYSGSRDYRAPEVILMSVGNSKKNKQAQSKGYGKPADMWSLGVVLYVMLSAERAFETYNAVETEIIQGHPITKLGESPWENISEEAKDLVRSLMQQDPKTRLTAEQVKLHKWLQSTLPEEASAAS